LTWFIWFHKHEIKLSYVRCDLGYEVKFLTVQHWRLILIWIETWWKSFQNSVLTYARLTQMMKLPFGWGLMKKTLHLIKLIVLDPISENLNKPLSKHIVWERGNELACRRIPLSCVSNLWKRFSNSFNFKHCRRTWQQRWAHVVNLEVEWESRSCNPSAKRKCVFIWKGSSFIVWNLETILMGTATKSQKSNIFCHFQSLWNVHKPNFTLVPWGYPKLLGRKKVKIYH